ncbi:MAG: cyclophilin-like fold protein [Hyphomicrobiales bacterium]|nr:cyclophilin-like fold protein [Hyphomicrobiales bacterium]
MQAAVSLLFLSSMDCAMAQDRIKMTSEWGQVTAVLTTNASAASLRRMLPVTIKMRDHMRQEKTGHLPAPLPEAPRQRGFSKGTIGLWGSSDFVIYYREGRVPAPGIVILGSAQGDVSIFDRLVPVDVQIEMEKP